MKRINIFLGLAVIFLGLYNFGLRAENDQGIVYMESDEAGGPEIIYNKPVRGVLFSHKYHVKELGLSCESCHSGIFEMQALKSQENSDFNMDSLYKGKYCGACHDGKTAFASNTKCASCHVGVKGMKKFENKISKKSSNKK